jgi:phage FluMu gp28-like protein
MKKKKKVDNILFPFQKKYIRLHKEKVVIWEKSRRIGATFTNAFYSIWYCYNYKQNCCFSSSKLDYAKDFLCDVRIWGELIEATTGRSVINEVNSTKNTIFLNNGKKIMALSSEPKNLRSKEGLIILDEFAHHDDQESMWRAAQGSIARKGQLRVLSTHNGPSCFFYKLVKEENGFAKMKTTMQDALKDGYLETTDFEDKDAYMSYLKQLSYGSDDIFGQEYNCEVYNAEKSMLTPKEIEDVQLFDLQDNEAKAIDSGRQSFIFVDVGATNNFTVATRIEKVLNLEAKTKYEKYDYLVTNVLYIHNLSIQEQSSKLKNFISLNKPTEIGIDNRGIGTFMADELAELVPDIIRYNATNKTNERAYETLCSFVKTGRINIPKDEIVKKDFLSLKRIASGNLVRYEGNVGNSHIDFVNSMAYALQIAKDYETGGTIFL